MYLYCRDQNQPAAGRAARIALMAAALLAAPGARAQASASVALASDYSVRGVSLSDGRPAPQLSLAYDAAPGWYAGAFAAPRLSLGQRAGVTQLVAYGGYARRLASALSWEAGASSTSFRNASEYNYREVYAGLAADRVSARLYFSPSYYGDGGHAVYGELNGFYPLRERIRLIAHIGALRAPAAHRADLRLALGYDAGACNVQLAWLGRSGHGDTAAPRAISLSATYSF